MYEFVSNGDPPTYFTYLLCFECKEGNRSNIDKQISHYICPELENRNFSLISECNSSIIDVYSFGWYVVDKTCCEQRSLMETVFSSLTHPSVIDTSIYKCKSAPLARPFPSKLLSSTFLKHPLVKYKNFDFFDFFDFFLNIFIYKNRCIQYLDNKSIKDNDQKFVYYQQLLKYLPSFPDVHSLSSHSCSIDNLHSIHSSLIRG